MVRHVPSMQGPSMANAFSNRILRLPLNRTRSPGPSIPCRRVPADTEVATSDTCVPRGGETSCAAAAISGPTRRPHGPVAPCANEPRPAARPPAPKLRPVRRWRSGRRRVPGRQTRGERSGVRHRALTASVPTGIASTQVNAPPRRPAGHNGGGVGDGPRIEGHRQVRFFTRSHRAPLRSYWPTGSLSRCSATRSFSTSHTGCRAPRSTGDGYDGDVIVTGRRPPRIVPRRGRRTRSP